MATRTKPQHDYFRPSEAREPEDYKGIPVTQVGVNVTNLGDGLSESATIEPMEIPIGSKVVGVFYAEVVSHEHDPAREGRTALEDELKLTHVLRAEGAFFPDPDLIAKAVDQHQARVKEHRAEMERQKLAAKGHMQLTDGAGAEASNGNGSEGADELAARREKGGKDAAAGPDGE